MPESLPSKDTEISLREYIESRLDNIVAHFDSKFDSTQRAVDKAERTMNDRLQSMNEFRDTLRDQAGKFATILQLEDRMTAALAQTSRVEERLRDLERNVITRETLDATIRTEQQARSAAVDRISRLEKFMWLLMGAFILLQVISRYLPSMIPSPR